MQSNGDEPDFRKVLSDEVSKVEKEGPLVQAQRAVQVLERERDYHLARRAALTAEVEQLAAKLPMDRATLVSKREKAACAAYKLQRAERGLKQKLQQREAHHAALRQQVQQLRAQLDQAKERKESEQKERAAEEAARVLEIRSQLAAECRDKLAALTAQHAALKEDERDLQQALSRRRLGQCVLVEGGNGGAPHLALLPEKLSKRHRAACLQSEKDLNTADSMKFKLASKLLEVKVRLLESSRALQLEKQPRAKRAASKKGRAGEKVGKRGGALEAAGTPHLVPHSTGPDPAAVAVEP